MAHLLGYRNLNTSEDFFKSDFYSKNQIDEIADPQGGNIDSPPTSIPSPFAAIDLTRAAFQRIVSSPDLKGTKIDQKLVSQCWDVGEMFFQSETFGDQVKIHEWKKRDSLAKLTSSPPGTGHKILGDTLKMFLTQDAKTYNFSQMDNLYILEYKYHMLGGTSPSTIFFSTLNDVENNSEVHVRLNGDDVLFDDDYKQLYERGDDFQLFIYSLKLQIPQFSSNHIELSDYLEKNLAIIHRINPSLFDRIKRLNKEEYFNQYSEMTTGHAGGHLTLFKNIPIRRKKKKTDGDSDFKIVSSKYQGKSPLVLTPDFLGTSQSGRQMTYFDCSFDNDIRNAIPYYSDIQIENRVLPGMTGQKYPYLLVSDLLEDTILKLIYPINRDKYFDGNLNSDQSEYGFILPLKKECFKYFSPDDLMSGNMPDGKPVFELESRGGGAGIKAILRIKIGVDYVEFTRLYREDGQVDLSRNEGGMKEVLLGVNIFPFIKSKVDTIKNEYRVHVLDAEHNYEKQISNLEFFIDSEQQGLIPNSIQKRSEFGSERYNTRTYIIGSTFDYIQLTHGHASGIILPNMPVFRGGSDVYKFSIDFGTTNTHIEYSIGDSLPKAFNINSHEIQMGTFHDIRFVDEYPDEGREHLNESIIHEMLPITLTTDSEYSFPQRTVLSEKKNLNLSQPTYALADFNIPFSYEKLNVPKGNRPTTNLKWSNYIQKDDDKKRVKAFLENIVLMIKAKILLNDGDPGSSEIIWFYPSSMLPNRKRELGRFWLDLVHQHISPSIQPKDISESIAPFYYYKKNLGLGAMTRPAISIDIGGGTTDIVIFEKDRPAHLSSFRFAANSLFGDAYSGSPERNGFVQKYMPVINHLLNENSSYIPKLLGVFPEIHESPHSRDIIAFYFSLVNNKSIIENRLEISFTEKLQNDQDLKLVVLLFYVSIVYHVAKLMKLYNLNQPKDIIFSGNGSKIINILDQSINFEGLSKIASIVFQKVFEAEKRPIMKVQQFDQPKAITCKGGLLIKNQNKVDIDSIKRVLVGAKIEQTHVPKYPDLDSDLLMSVVDEVQDFIDMFFDLNSEFNFFREFTINAAILPQAREFLSDRDELIEYLEQGIQAKKEELYGNEDIQLEESLFFYPLTGMLNSLAYHLYQKS